MAKLSLNAGAGIASQSLTNLFQSKATKDSNWNQFLSSQAEIFSKEVGELKGSIMKAGQMLSMYGEYFFPPEVNQFFKTLQQDTPSLKWEAIEPLIISYLGQEKYSELEIDKEPIACASLGQVHRAKIKKTNEEIVLKVQYPKVDLAIDSDLKAIKSFIQFLKIIPKEMNLDAIFSEIKTMLLQESDYEHEAKKTMEFHDRLKNDNRFIVPTIYPEYSNKKILAASFESGLRLDSDVIQSLTQERRNRLAKNFLELFYMELFEWQELQTDPHSGNYKIRLNAQGNDQWVLYDFGATRAYPDDFLDTYYGMIKGALLKDIELFTNSAKKLKFIYDNDEVGLLEVFESFCFETVEPFMLPTDPRQKGPMDKEGNYDWKNTDLPKRLSNKVIEILKKYSWRTPPKELLFLDRKTGGVFIIMSMLKAKMNSRDILMKHLNNL
jgi:predicted unusual protein kinase regulating ubiquinone biosynthesis (AarF/ABC1/UbiB family)